MQNQDWQEMQRKQREYEQQQDVNEPRNPLAMKPQWGPTTDYTTYVERPGCVTIYALLLALGVLFNAVAGMDVWQDYTDNERVCIASDSIFRQDCGSYREMFTKLIGVPPSLFLAYGGLVIGIALFAIPSIWRMKQHGWWAVVTLQVLNLLAILFIKTRVVVPQFVAAIIVLFWFWRNRERFE